jgi:hypothetical protein
MTLHLCPDCRGELRLVVSGEYGWCPSCTHQHNAFAYAPIGHTRPHPSGLTLGRQFRDEGMALVVENAGPDVMDAHLALIEDLARTMPELTADDVRAAALERSLVPPHSPNAYGAYMRIAAGRGYIKRTNLLIQSSRPDARAHANPAWRSLLFTATPQPSEVW